MRSILLLLALATSTACFADKKPPHLATGKLLDFTEERYNSDHASPFGSQSCVNRDYTVDLSERILVIRHNTCMPVRDPALHVVVGREIQIEFDDQKEDRIAILDAKGKPHWYKLFKITEKQK